MNVVLDSFRVDSGGIRAATFSIPARFIFDLRGDFFDPCTILFPTVQEMVGVRLFGMGFLFDLLDLRCDGGRQFLILDRESSAADPAQSVVSC